jgi:hypothetical protein
VHTVKLEPHGGRIRLAKHFVATVKAQTLHADGMAAPVMLRRCQGRAKDGVQAGTGLGCSALCFMQQHGVHWRITPTAAWLILHTTPNAWAIPLLRPLP